jgi:hypothetical protein
MDAIQQLVVEFLADLDSALAQHRVDVLGLECEGVVLQVPLVMG